MQQLAFKYQLIIKPELIELRTHSIFEQEDMTPMAHYLLSKIVDSTLIDIVEGVDRACYRVELQGQNFTINFEIYSQSCWLEPEAAQELTILHKVAPFL